MPFESSFAFFGTIYNNVHTVDLTLSSINNVIDLLPEVSFEIAVVDNYSSDGSFEKLQYYQKIFEQKSNVKSFKILRRKSSRGLGRQLALLLTSSEYVIPIDFDCIYRSSVLGMLIRDILKYDLKCVLLGNEGLYYICLRDYVVDIGGYRDLNYGEDTDILVRLCCFKEVVSLPVAISVNLGSYIRRGERRYARGFQFLLRSLRNFVEKMLVGGYNPGKLFLRYRFYYHRGLLKTLTLTTLRSMIAVPLKLHPLNSSRLAHECKILRRVDSFTYRDICIAEGLRRAPKELLTKYSHVFDPRWRNFEDQKSFKIQF